MVSEMDDRPRGRRKVQRCRSRQQLSCAECHEARTWQSSKHNTAGYGMAYGKWYCDICWLRWFQAQEIAEPLLCPRRYEGKAVRQFGGQTVHVLQIGLGNFATFLQRDAEWL